jgi:hypothetical protein
VTTGAQPPAGRIPAICDNCGTVFASGRVQALASALTAAQQATDRSAAERALQDEPTLADIVQRLLIPRDAGQFWALIAALAVSSR